ncbi:YdcH family protein [Aquamicrobium segne]|uniref:YdcH family protein n=1 Tax=Aquamicrobium segne TaxID=469547 RepID=A0ABW0GTN4_9HYPH
MSLASHLDELQKKHSEIERQIDTAMQHPSTDGLEIVDLKRRKLAIKDMIEKLREGTASD